LCVGAVGNKGIYNEFMGLVASDAAHSHRLQPPKARGSSREAAEKEAAVYLLATVGEAPIALVREVKGEARDDETESAFEEVQETLANVDRYCVQFAQRSRHSRHIQR
jgi:hypothetical protein